MLFACILMCVIGIIFLILGWLLWKKEKIEILHDYHYNKVSEENKKAFCETNGKATITIGLGLLLSGIVCFGFNSAFGWIFFGLCFIGGLAQYIIAGIKYNR